MSTHLLEGAGRVGIGADRQFHLGKESGADRRCDADQANRLPGLVHGLQEFLDCGIHRTVAALGGEGGEILGGPEAAGQDRGVEVVGIGLREIDDLAPGDSRGLGENVAAFSRRFFAASMVDDVHLGPVGCEALNVRIGAIQRQQRDDAFVDLGTIEVTTAR